MRRSLHDSANDKTSNPGSFAVLLRRERATSQDRSKKVEPAFRYELVWLLKDRRIMVYEPAAYGNDRLCVSLSLILVKRKRAYSAGDEMTINLRSISRYDPWQP